MKHIQQQNRQKKALQCYPVSGAGGKNYLKKRKKIIKKMEFVVRRIF